MASNPSPEASEIRRRGRRRLIGAVALVLLLVVFVPMILDPEPRPVRNEPTLAIPPKDNAPPLPSPPPAAQSPAVAPAKAGSQSPAVAPAQSPAVAPAQSPAVAPAQSPAVAPAKAGAQSPPKLEGFAVQVGAFRDEALLAQAREKLAAAGVVHYTERIDAAGGPLTRLRAGPFPTREAAEGALAKLKRAQLEGKVVPLS